MASGAADGAVVVWALGNAYPSDWLARQALAGGASSPRMRAVLSLAWSPDGTRVAAGLRDRSAHWHPESSRSTQ